MKKFNGYEEAQVIQGGSFEKLPPGGYVLRVLGVREEPPKSPKSYGRLVLQVDIAEGEKKDFFKKQYEESTIEDKKWKGTASIYCPITDEEGIRQMSEKEVDQNNYTKRRFKTTMALFEEANNGYVWDWDESKLKNKIIGGIYGTRNTRIDGRDISYTAFRYFESVANIRDGKFKIPEAKTDSGYGGGSSSGAKADDNGFMDMQIGPEEIPF